LRGNRLEIRRLHLISRVKSVERVDDQMNRANFCLRQQRTLSFMRRQGRDKGKVDRDKKAVGW
jgi:hypothetical protein